MKTNLNKFLIRAKRAVKLIVTDPLFFVERLKLHLSWLGWKLFRIPVRKKLGTACFHFDFTIAPTLKSMFFGYYDVHVVNYVKKNLRPGDTFIDVGANIGYITAVAAGVVGKSGQVHSFEPAPRYFVKLKKFSQDNPDHRIVVNPFALGCKEENLWLRFDKKNIGANVIREEKEGDAVRVPIKRLDDYIEKHGLHDISLIKIDVEGYEYPVLKGLEGYLRATRHRPAILCEIFPFFYPNHGVTFSEVVNYMKSYGYRFYSLLDTSYKLQPEDLPDEMEEYNFLFKA